MIVRRLELVDFRSYPRAEVEFEPGPSVLVGPNGHGKTNLVEAIGYVATLGSHRVATDQPLVRFGAERAIIRCAIVHDERELLVELEIVPGKANRARLGRSPAARARDVIGALRLVLFAPEDLALVRGDPAERRRYLDDLLVQRQPRYAGVRADYERVLKQRNALLRTAYLARKVGGTGGRTGDLSTLDVWDVHLAQHGADLIAARLELCAALGTHVAKAYDAVSAGRGEARMTYEGKSWLETSPRDLDRAAIEEHLLTALGAARSSEVERGVTLVGPHRDDLTLTLGELPAKRLRQPRRVVVVRARAAAGGVRTAARRGDRAGARARRRVRRARHGPPAAARGDGLAGEPGAGHLRGRAGRAGLIGRYPLHGGGRSR